MSDLGVQDPYPPESSGPDQAPEDRDPLARFRSWRGFLVAAVAVNLLFVITMLGHTSPEAGIWHKVLIWFPFNAIATAVYLAIMARLTRPDQASPATKAGAMLRSFYTILCIALIVANWALMFAA